jgi:hypothetical protein
MRAALRHRMVQSFLALMSVHQYCINHELFLFFSFLPVVVFVEAYERMNSLRRLEVIVTFQ